MAQGRTTNLPNGVTNSDEYAQLGSFILPDPSSVFMYFNDFLSFTAADWVITTVEGGGGSASEVVSNSLGGQLVITNDDAAPDADWFQYAGGTGGVLEQFAVSTDRVWFKTRFKVSDAVQSNVVAGLQITDTTPMAVSDGVYFRKDDGDALIDFVVVKDSTATTLLGVGTLVSDTFVELAWAYDPAEGYSVFVNNKKVGSAPTTNTPNDEPLTVSFGIGNGEAVSKIMTMDYILAAQERAVLPQV